MSLAIWRFSAPQFNISCMFHTVAVAVAASASAPACAADSAAAVTVRGAIQWMAAYQWVWNCRSGAHIHTHRHTHTQSQTYAACAFCPLVTCANRANGNANADVAAIANANAAHMEHKLHVNLVNLDAAVCVRAKGQSHSFVIHLRLSTTLLVVFGNLFVSVCVRLCYVSRQEVRKSERDIKNIRRQEKLKLRV